MANNSGFNLPVGMLVSGLSTVGNGVTNSADSNVEKAALHLEGAIKDRAPVDTGHLRSSYSTRVEGSVAHVGTNVPYALPQEYGTRYQSGTPHVRPAIEAERGEMFGIMAGSIKDALKSV